MAAAGPALRQPANRADGCWILAGMGWDVEITPNQPVETGIRALRMSLAQTYIDRNKAARLLECLKRYRRGVPATTGEPGKPVHDEWSRNRRSALHGDQCRGIEQQKSGANRP